jgi:hypothetical protein
MQHAQKSDDTPTQSVPTAAAAALPSLGTSSNTDSCTVCRWHQYTTGTILESHGGAHVGIPAIDRQNCQNSTKKMAHIRIHQQQHTMSCATHDGPCAASSVNLLNRAQHPAFHISRTAKPQSPPCVQCSTCTPPTQHHRLSARPASAFASLHRNNTKPCQKHEASHVCSAVQSTTPTNTACFAGWVWLACNFSLKPG